MHILHFINDTNLSWYTMLTDTLRAQMERGARVSIALPPGGTNFKRLKEDGFAAIPLLVRNGKLDYLAAWRLAGIIRREKADVLHTHLTSAALLGSAAARWAGIPCAASVLKMTKKIRYMKCSILLPCSDAVRDDLLSQGVPAGMMRRVYTGIDVEKFMEGFAGAGTVRAELGFSADDLVIGTVARLAPMKGHHILLDAMPHVFAKYPRARLLIVGDGELRAALEQQTKKLHIEDRTVFAGTRRDLQNILASIDISVLASIEKEGLPVILVQSVLAGKPVVMTDVAGISEIVKDGVTGYLAPPGNPEALTAALCAALSDPAEAARRADAAREFVAREFDVRHTAEQMDEVYEKLLSVRQKSHT